MPNPLEDDNDIVTQKLADLCRVMERYLSKQDADKVYKAFTLAEKAHKGVKRKSGEPYITHPIEVAIILADLHMDADTLSAALMHDVIEDTYYTYNDLSQQFSREIADLVEGVTKLKARDYESKQAAGVASFHKMMQAMVKDYRVVLIKLADRLHNASTLSSMKPDSQRRIAKETLEIHVPLARRMGMNRLRNKLQMHAFRSMYPNRSKILQKWWDTQLEKNSEKHNDILIEIQNELEKEKIKGYTVFEWKKNLFRLYQKEKQRKTRKNFDRTDVSFDVRILTTNTLDCYKVLGILHNLYQPKMDGIKDFIATPKVYGFQALQTTLLSYDQQLLCIQIQSKEMYQVAQYGIASQWRFPHLSTDQQLRIAQRRLEKWLRQVAEIQQAPGNAEEFLEDMKAEFFFNEVSVLTPKGDSTVLRVGSTPIDFAYAINTKKIGHRCVGARINGQSVALNTRLHNGATVEIITEKTAVPSPTWLNFAVTGQARAAIRSWMANRHESEFVALGKNLLNRAISRFDMVLDDISPERKQEVLTTLKFNNEDDFYRAIALGQQNAKLVARRLLNNTGLQTTEPINEKELIIKGTEGLALQLKDCCHPIPTDNIVAEISPTSGLEVHRVDCPSSRHISRDTNITLSWSEDIQQTFAVPLQLQLRNEVGALFAITNTLQEQGFNIEDLNITGDKDIKELRLLIRIKNIHKLTKLLKSLKTEKTVISAKRIFSLSQEYPHE